ncbi:hypothetical protein RMATCC62417_12285 [Rhizopus microsporus]|nr:hypothetical protein RMATCC62417_12285 [Rhizopus microsporus]
MSHSEPVNHNPDTGTSSSTTPSHANKSATLWHSFRAYAHSIKSASVTVFGDKAAKSASRQRRQARLWVQSPEKT